jgi:hypothetical protein
MKKVESFEEFGKRSIMPDHKDEGLLEFRITFTWVHYSRPQPTLLQPGNEKMHFLFGNRYKEGNV